MQSRHTDTDVENRYMDTKVKGEVRGIGRWTHISY